MKRITQLALVLMTGYFGFAQTSFEASPNFGKLMDVTYDANIQNKLYAATQGNHLVVSTDNGLNWSLLYSFPGSTFLNDLRLVPGNAALSFSTKSNIYIFSLLTNSITATFPVPQSGVEGAGPSYVSTYSLFDATGTIMVVDTGIPVGFSTQGKTFFTKDGGTTWTEIYYTVDNDNVFIDNVSMSPTDDQKVFLARGLGNSGVNGGLWISNDEGMNWTESLVGLPVDPIAFNPENANDIFVGTGISFGQLPENLFRSVDGGITWTAQTITWSDQSLNNITSIKFNPTNNQQVILLEENEIIRTANNGTSWENLVYPVDVAMDYYYGTNASYNPFNSNQIAVTTDYYPQFLDNTTSLLTQIKVPFYNISSTVVGKYPNAKDLYYGAQGGRFRKNINSDETSIYDTQDPNVFSTRKNYMIADPIVPGRVFTYASMGFFGGNLNMSTDYGATTTNILQSFADDIQELTVDPNNNSVIYVSMRSSEGSTVLKVDFTDLADILTTEITTPQLNEFGTGVVTGIVVSATDSNTIFIAKKTGFYKSVDGGLNWTLSANGLESIDESTDLIWDMQQNPLNANQLTLCSNVGVYTSVDSGENWSLLLPGVDVRRVKHSPTNTNVIVATVFSNMYESASIVYTTDGGQNWTTISSEDLNHIQSYAMDYDFDGDTIYAYIGTTDLGVVKYEIHDASLATTPFAVSSNSISIYPNPATASVTIATDAVVEAAVFSLTGQQVLSSSSKTFDISGLSNGVYIVKVKTASGDDFVQKLVKK